MSEALVSSEDLRQAAEAFRLAAQESQATRLRLQAAGDHLRGQWSGLAQELFYAHYQTWLQYSGALVLVLGEVADELAALAERYEQSDR